ncbi:MAG: hypothetical protein U0X20_16220 [Caldilineaceae bacterium]
MDSNVLLLSQLSPYQVAQMIRALDSRLIGIEGETQGAVVRLIYSFAVAGGTQHFRVNVRGPAVPSIAALYPAAQSFEAALAQRLGLVFHAPDGPGADE